MPLFKRAVAWARAADHPRHTPAFPARQCPPRGLSRSMAIGASCHNRLKFDRNFRQEYLLAKGYNTARDAGKRPSGTSVRSSGASLGLDNSPRGIETWQRKSFNKGQFQPNSSAAGNRCAKNSRLLPKRFPRTNSITDLYRSYARLRKCSGTWRSGISMWQILRAGEKAPTRLTNFRGTDIRPKRESSTR